MRKIIRLAKGSSFFEIHPAHFRVVGINPAHAVIGAARSISHVALLENFRRKPLEQRNFGADVIERSRPVRGPAAPPKRHRTRPDDPTPTPAKKARMGGVPNPPGGGIWHRPQKNPAVIASPAPPLSNVRNAPSTKNCVRMFRWVAPKALRRPISFVRSATETSMIFTIPMAPRTSVTRPTTPRK